MRGEGLGASVDCQASVDTSTSLAPDTTSSAVSALVDPSTLSSGDSTSSAAAAAEEAKVQAEEAIAEASAAKETAEAVSSALADVDSLLVSLLARKRQQEVARRRRHWKQAGLEAKSVAGGISPPTSCAAFAHMMDQVSSTSFFVGQEVMGQRQGYPSICIPCRDLPGVTLADEEYTN